MRKAYARAKEIITSHRAQFDTLVERLLEKEVVEAAEIDEILGLAAPKEKVAEKTPEVKEQPTAEKPATAAQAEKADNPQQGELF